MDEQFAEWLYLQQIVGNFENLVHYYFGAVSSFGPWFRQAAVGVMYSMGLAWAGFCFIKAPVDRLQQGLSVMGMVLLCGFLLSPTTNTKNLGSYSGTELSVGGYYSYLLVGTMTDVFSQILQAGWKNSIVESVGGGGPSKDNIALAFNDQAVQFATKFIKGEGRDAYVDYYKKCGSQALSQAKTPQEKAILKTIGIGASTLGMSAEDATTMVQNYQRIKNKNLDLGTMLGSMGEMDGGLTQANAEIDMFNQNRDKAQEFLKDLPSANNDIDGNKGYRIPSAEYYKTKLSDTEGSQTSSNPSFKSVSGSGGDFAKMLPNGATATTPGGDDDYIFYPKNCADLYQVASETMANLREGAKNVPGYEKLPNAGGYVAMSAANLVDRGIKDQMAEIAKQAGVNADFDTKMWEQVVNNFQAGMSSVGNEYNNFMLKYKIPFMIAGMAVIVDLLLILFPVFALIAVIFGPKTLVTYFKLMAFPFLVVFVNNLLLILAANVISFNKMAKIMPETFMPGAVDVSNALATMNTETLIYSVICVAEIAIVRLILWDDVKAVTGFNVGAAAGSATERGMSLTGKALAMVGGAFGRVGKMSSASNAASAAASTQRTNNHIAAISQGVSSIASQGSRMTRDLSGISTPKPQNGSSQPGGNPNGGNPGPSLNPPKP